MVTKLRFMLIGFLHQLYKAGQRTHWWFCPWV